MIVELKYFAALREQLGCAAERVELPAEVMTIGDARAFLAARSDGWRTALLAPRIRAALDQRLADDATSIHDGAELAFFPPVTGG